MSSAAESKLVDLTIPAKGYAVDNAQGSFKPFTFKRRAPQDFDIQIDIKVRVPDPKCIIDRVPSASHQLV